MNDNEKLEVYLETLSSLHAGFLMNFTLNDMMLNSLKQLNAEYTGMSELGMLLNIDLHEQTLKPLLATLEPYCNVLRDNIIYAQKALKALILKMLPYASEERKQELIEQLEQIEELLSSVRNPENNMRMN